MRLSVLSLRVEPDALLSDGTVVSGDSLGNVKFWDAKTSTQLQSYQPHGADVLCLTIGPVRRVPWGDWES